LFGQRGCCSRIDERCSNHLESTIRCLFQSRALSGLVVSLAVEHLAIESDMGVEEGFWCDILKDVDAIAGIEFDLWCGVGEDASEAVCAVDVAGGCIGDAEVELGAGGKAVRHDGDFAGAAPAGLVSGHTDCFLEDWAAFCNLKGEWRGGMVLVAGGVVDICPDAVAAEFSDGEQGSEVDSAGNLPSRRDEDGGIGVTR